ncbi:MAG: hypothetical protein AB1726_09560, partial [Planctomycetota bacterium]
LARGGRAGAEELRASLDLFVRHRADLARERGKILMHTGPATQGSHYLLFDYSTAALAAAALPAGARARYREAILEEVLRLRAAGGCFIDNPSRGRACGTGLALLALAALR